MLLLFLIRKITILVTLITSFTNFHKFFLHFPLLYLNPNNSTFFTLFLQIISSSLIQNHSVSQTKQKIHLFIIICLILHVNNTLCAKNYITLINCGLYVI